MNQSHRQTAVDLAGEKLGGNGGGRGRGRFSLVLVAGAIWLSLILTSMAMILHYTNAPGPTGTVPARWPAESRISLDASRPTLVMFAHPHCPCTRASLGELEQLMADCQGRLSAQVWFIKPAGTAADWTDTDLWRQAAAIPGVTAHRDELGTEARRFQAGTSGQTVLYDQTGHLLFQGGITLSRGHFGDNPGRSALEALLEHRFLSQNHTPVFGCGLFEAQCRAEQGGGACKP